MATGGQSENSCSLINVERVTLESPNKNPVYRGIVVCRNQIFVIDGGENNVCIYGLHNGKLLYESDRLQSWPSALHLINDTDIAVILVNGLIKIMSTHNTPVIRWTRDLRVQAGLDLYHGVVSFKGDFVVCGVKKNTACWCVVSSIDGRVVGTIHQICKVNEYSSSFITAKHNIIYISCSVDNGVYAYDVQNPSQSKYSYKHKDLNSPRGIVINQHGSLFVCNFLNPYNCIHHLTSECQLMSIITQGIPRYPWAIFWDDGLLYVTCWNSNDITRYRTQYPDPIIPSEVLNMNPRSIEMFKKALRDGKEKVFNIRIMVVGPYDVGKTTLTKHLLGKDVNIHDRQSTEGIDIQTECCKVSLATGEWITQEQKLDSDKLQVLLDSVNIDAEQYWRLQRLVKFLNEQVQQKPNDKVQEPKEMEVHVISGKQYNVHAQHDQSVKAKQDVDQEVMPTLYQPVESPIAILSPEASSEVESRENEKKDAVMEILQLINMNSDKLEKGMVEYAKLGMWDFAGQYVFYTTHQTFLSYRAVYILVIDLSQPITALINDECFLDAAGLKKCEVQDMIHTWMNSIHSCTPSPQSGIPAVILVGTHVDKIPEKSRQEVIGKYFMEIRRILKDKPTIVHLMYDIAIDNTLQDPRLEELKRIIFKLASQQPHWGEEKPARWIPMEQAIMTLKSSGTKVVKISILDELNKLGSVRIEGKDEMDLFLRFQHEIGSILYFSAEGLSDTIVLDPQWTIDALKSLITAEMFISDIPAITSKWFEFKDNGKLTHELIDAIWTKEKNPDFHDNKNYLLLLMEKLNLIARPKSYGEDGKEVKEEDYYLAPCMLHEAMPKTIISPESDPEIGNTSVLCFVCTAKFLPPPVFHRLLGACLTHWPIVKQLNQNLIYCGCCVFDLDSVHKLTIYFRDYVIFTRVKGVGAINMHQSSEVCCKVKSFIWENLTRIIGTLGQSLQFELHVQCPKTDPESLEGLIAVSKLQKSEKVRCDSHENSHMLESQNLLKFWFEDKEPSDAGCKLENLPVQGEIEVSQKGNFKAVTDQTEAVFIHKKLAELAKSIGIIRTSCGSGTGFRVGPNYIMTARHVIEPVMRKVPFLQQQQPQLLGQHQLSDANVFIDFCYEWNSLPCDPNLMFYFEPEIVYESAHLDTAILKLKADTKVYPPPLTEFTDVTRLSQDKSHGYFIGHSQAAIKKTDKYQYVTLTNFDIDNAKKWSMDFINEDGYDGIENQQRVLFHCSFEQGASGSPGFWINPSDGQAYVELMLLCGYPKWLYDKYQGNTSGIPNNFFVEQGVSMKSVYDDVKAKDELLCNTIFGRR